MERLIGHMGKRGLCTSFFDGEDNSYIKQEDSLLSLLAQHLKANNEADIARASETKMILFAIRTLWRNGEYSIKNPLK